MNRSEGFEKLKTIGAQKIHEKTHISKYHVQALLHNNFDEMTKIQFLGFVSILEREYNLHLDELRERGLEHFYNLRAISEDKRIFLQPNKTKSNSTFYVVLVTIFILIGMSYSYFVTQEEQELIVTIQDNETIKIVQEEILGISDDLNSTENNETINQEVLEEAALFQAEELAHKELSLKIIPHAKLWLGYIDLSTHRKLQTTTSNPIELDPNKDWLLSLGHADVSVLVHGVTHKYNKATNIRFLYKDHEFKEISFSEFKSLNKGAIW
ncbi:MAG: hypothetical protein RBR59_01550 [Sulfurimonadaceae bacterium]|jgi:hypothetical protein|nr:hypothetical protein [Sulfurimonadaceae bacterium]